MSERKKKDDKYMDFAKKLFAKPEEQVVRKPEKVEIKKPRITAPVRAFMDKTGQEAFDEFGQKTLEYVEWYQDVWPTIRKTTKRKVTVIEEEISEVPAGPDLTPLIRQNTKALMELTNYIRSIDTSLKSLTQQPLKVEVVK